MHGDYVKCTIVQYGELYYFDSDVYDEDYDSEIYHFFPNVANFHALEHIISSPELV